MKFDLPAVQANSPRKLPAVKRLTRKRSRSTDLPRHFGPPAIVSAALALISLTPELPAWSAFPLCSSGIPAFIAQNTDAPKLNQSGQAPATPPGENQAGTPPDLAPPVAPARTGVRPRPHLIELTAGNWKPLKTSEKFELFWGDIISPWVHVTLAADAAITYAIDDSQYLGRGWRGFGRHYGFNLADEANTTFIQAFLLPTLLHEDPRYVPLETGSIRHRAAYALSRIVMTKRDSGEVGLNRSKLLGTVISEAASNYYTPQGLIKTWEATVTRTAISLGSDAAFNIFKEFWPDFARKVRMKVWIESLVQHSIRDVIRVD